MAEKKYDKLWAAAQKKVEARRAAKGKPGAPADKVAKAFMKNMVKRTDFKKSGERRITSMEGADFYASQKMKRLTRKK